jgi:DNA-binding transcriptional LysR family regulator
MEQQQLRCLLAVVDAGSFTRAAERLHVTQGAVSRAITTLERELAVALVRRTPQPVAATEAGERLVVHARAALARLRSAEEEILALRGLNAGQLRVGSFSSASTRLLPPLLAAYRQQHPQVEVSLREGNDFQALRWLDGGEVDVSFVVTPAENLETVELAQDELVLVLPRDHSLAGRSLSVPLASLQNEPLVLSTGGCAALVRSTFDRHKLKIKQAHVSQEGATAIAMVEARLGLTLMPALAVPPLP